MSIKYPKNVIVSFSVIAALMTATVLLGGYANSKQSDSAKLGCCPAMSNMAACPQTAVVQAESTGCSKTPCTTGCPKPCCAGEDAGGVCDDPCPVPCPKPCCAENSPKDCCRTAGSTGCPIAAVEADAE